MVSEETPLLVSVDHDDVYNRFSTNRKRAILWMVSAAGILPMLVAGTFTPSILQIAKDLNTTGAIVNIAISLASVAISLGGLTGSSYSTFYGRRPVYVYTLPFLVLGSFGAATASNVPSLLIWRFFQALGASPGHVIGAGVIGDIHKLEERGSAMGIFFAAILLGPTLAPLLGGTVTHYFSWRFMQGSLGIMGFLVWLLVFFFFPETSQPGARGIDQLREKEGENWKERFIFVNPLRPLALLRSPNLFLIAIATSTISLAVFVLLIPLAYTIGLRYDIANEGILGLCFLPSGLGCIVGAQLVGRISDLTVIRWKKKRNGIWYPEDRLRAALIPFSLVAPIAVLGFGVANQFLEGPIGLCACMLALFLAGVGIEMSFGPCAAYLVDVMHTRSAESLGANNGLRSALMALGALAVLPMIESYGIAVTNAISAGLIWVGLGVLIWVIHSGEKMRAWVDVGFSTADNN